jgi:hypothetical protein
MKAQKLRDALGDYRNVSKFAAMLRAVGGPFVAFRMGIVPKAVGRSLTSRPDRPTRMVRAQNDIDDEMRREGAPGGLNIGGPMDDAARMAFKLPDFLTSTASVGPLGDAARVAFHGQGPMQTMGNLASEYIPGARFAAGSVGSAFPYDRLPPGVTPMQAAIASAFGMYFTWPTSVKRRQDIEKETRR